MAEVETTDQGEPQSVTDRIAAKFGITDDPQEAQENIQVEGDEAEEAEEVPESADVEIEYEGERFKIPKQLEKAILQERDYTRKSQELADQRRQVEHERKMAEAFHMKREFDQSVSAEVEQINAYERYLKYLDTVDIRSLSIEDQLAHLAEKERIPRQIAEVQKQLDGKRAEFDKKANEKIAEIKRNAREVLAKSVPGYSDEVMQSVVSHAKSVGFSEQEVDGITIDPRAAMVLYQAMKYAQLQSKKGDAVKKATATPVVKPGASNPMPQAVKDKLAFNKAMKAAKNSQEKAKLIEQRLAGQF